LKNPIRAEHTLVAFHEASVTWRKTNKTEAFSVVLPRAEAGLFNQVIKWMNHEPLDKFEEEEYDDEETHVSKLLILHILASKFGTRDLAAEAFKWYKPCRSPYWEGVWLPLPGEISYIIDSEPHSIEVKDHVARHIMSLYFSCRCAGSLGKIAVLLACDQDLTLAVLRAVRHHMSESVSTTYFCGVDGCMHHPEHWTLSDIEDGNRPPSEDEFSVSMELNDHPPSGTITKDDEDAIHAAEVLEVLSEVHDSGWCPVNKTVS